VLPEGADCPQSLSGAQTLAEDIQRNEIETGVFFKHVFLDMGTGLTAEALVSAINLQNRTLHLVVCAGEFQEAQKRFQSELILKFYDETKRFGDPSREQLKLIREIFQTQGVLIDPIYGVKTWSVLKREIRSLKSEPTLIIHSGGAHSIHGYNLGRVKLS